MRKLLVIALTITLIAATTWFVTGSHPYTKFEDVVQKDVEADPDDPFAEAGFYDGTTATRTVKKNVFYFGLLPTPSGLLDPHALSVASVVGPLWAIVVGVALLRLIQRRAAKVNMSPTVSIYTPAVPSTRSHPREQH